MKERRVSDLRVEQLMLGELTPEAQAALRARLAAEPGGLARLAALAEDTDATLARHPAAAVAAEVERRLQRRRPPRLVLGLVPLAAAAAAVFLVTCTPLALQAALPESGAPTERAKGALHSALAIHRQVASSAELLTEGAAAHPGDVVQLTVAPRGAGHGVIVSVDGRGAVTLHFPERPGGSTALPGGLPSVAVAHAYELDDAPAYERFFLVTAQHPINVAAVVDAARTLAAQGDTARTAALPLSADHAQATILLRKTQ